MPISYKLLRNRAGKTHSLVISFEFISHVINAQPSMKYNNSALLHQHFTIIKKRPVCQNISKSTFLRVDHRLICILSAVHQIAEKVMAFRKLLSLIENPLNSRLWLLVIDYFGLTPSSWASEPLSLSSLPHTVLSPYADSVHIQTCHSRALSHHNHLSMVPSTVGFTFAQSSFAQSTQFFIFPLFTPVPVDHFCREVTPHKMPH